MHMKAKTVNKVQEFACVLPAILFLLFFTYYPVAWLVKLGFTDWNLLKDSYNYVGLKNWKWLLAGSGTKYMLNALKVTVIYSLGELCITIVGGLFFAMIFRKMSRSFSAMRTLVFMPRYVAMSSAAVVFLWLLDTDHGVVNYLLSLAGVAPVEWFKTGFTAMLSVLMVTGWKSVGYGMMIYISSMMGISKDYYEASSLDGANKVQQFFKITLPMLSPTTLFLLVTTFISSMKVFQSIDILTSGGPYRSTEVYVYLIYRYAMEEFRVDRAAVMAIVLFVILLVFTVSTMKVSNKSVNYDA